MSSPIPTITTAMSAATGHQLDKQISTRGHVAWEALGLAEFPIVTTSKSRPPKDTIEFEEKTTRKGVTTTRSWAMVASSEYGLPRLYDLDLYIAINVLAERYGYEARLIKTTIHELCTIPGLTPGGTTYERVKAGARRFANTGYSARGVFWTSEGRQPTEVEEWRILAEARLLATTADGSTADGLPASYILLGEKFLSILKRERRKPLDLSFWQKLGGGIAKPLFHYLDTSLYNRDRFEIGLYRLGNHIGQATRYAPSQAMRLFAPYLKRFVDLGFLSEFKFERSRSAEDPYKVVVFRGENARRSVSRSNQVQNHPPYRRAPSEERITRNSAIPETRQDPEVLLRQEFRQWCIAEAERRFRALPTSTRDAMLADAVRDMTSQHELYGKTPRHLIARFAERRICKKLEKELPSFDDWKQGHRTLDNQAT